MSKIKSVPRASKKSKRKLSTYQQEMLAYKEQEKYITETYGKKAAARANYGAGVQEFEDSVSVETKGYYGGEVIITSVTQYGKVDHDIEG